MDCNKFNPFTALYKCTQYAGGKIRLFWCYYGVTYNFIQNHNHCRDLHQIFSCLFETFGTMSEIMFFSDSLTIFFSQQLKIHECLLSFTTSFFWNGWETMIQKCENDRNFLLYHCWFQLISIVIHIQAILDFQNNLYFKETQQTNATIACHLWKKTEFFIKRAVFPVKIQLLAAELWYKSWKS